MMLKLWEYVCMLSCVVHFLKAGENNSTSTGGEFNETTSAVVTSSSVGVGYWRNISVAVVPLVDPFDGEVNHKNNESIFFDPVIRGYSFPRNHQGKGKPTKTHNIHYSVDFLSRIWVSPEAPLVFTPSLAKACLSRFKWIHIDGDSLSRDTYYDIGELFGLGWNDKPKTQSDASQVYASTRITFGFDPTKKPPESRLSWRSQALPHQKCPDVWVYATGMY
jgi:hypothetical protein